MSDTAAIDDAVVAKLAGDATLMAITTGGVYFGVAPRGETKVVIVSMVIHEDEYSMRAKAYERVLYTVKAVMKAKTATGVSGADAAAARIDALLHDVALTITGYRHMLTLRTERVRYPELDEDSDERWQHSGGRYEVWAAPTS